MKDRRFKGLKGLILTFILIVGAGPVWAHHPIFEKPDTTGFEDALLIPDPSISWAVYANLESSADVDFYRLEVTPEIEFSVNLLTPYAPGYENFNPTFSVVGPGLGTAEPDLPFELPQGYGAVVMKPEPQNDRSTFFEPFSMTKYYRDNRKFKQTGLAPGAYYIVVWDQKGEYGGYVIGFGRAEKWTWKDLAPTIRAVIEVQKGHWMGVRGSGS